MRLMMRIKNLGMFTLVTIFLIAVLMTAPILNTVYQISYIDMKEVMILTIIAFVVYSMYFVRTVYVSGIRRR